MPRRLWTSPGRLQSCCSRSCKLLGDDDDDDEPYQVVADLLGAVPSGSYLALSHPTSDLQQEQVTAMVTQLNDLVAEKVTTRAQDQVARFFTGLELVEPGLVNVSEWRPAADGPAEEPAALWVCVGRKP